MSEREIFEGALEHTDPAGREAYLDRVCRNDAVLRKKVEALLASHDAASEFLNVPAPEQLRPTAGQTRTFDTSTPDGAAPDGADGGGPTEQDLTFLGPPAGRGGIGTLGHYAVLRLLGRGAFGLVFEAFDEKLHRHVAIKVLDPRLAATSPPRKRFLREARSAAAVRHENVVQVYAAEEHPLPHLVMEFVDGRTLQDRMDGTGPLDLPEILHLGRQMAAGLAAAHERGLIHRDIKPGNVLIEAGAEQRVKITDFGLARAADDASLTRSGVIAGTPMYMAPEQAQGLPLDHRADLFSLGSVLYQMASGRPPFRAATTVAVLRRVADEAPRPIREILPTVPDWLCSVIAKLHAKRPEDRFQSAREVADLFARSEASLRAGDGVALSPQSAPPPTGRRVSPGPSRRRWLAALAGLLLLGAAVGCVAAVWSHTTPKPSALVSPPEPDTGPTSPPGEVVPPTKPTRIVRTAADYDEIAPGRWLDLVPGPDAFDALVNANPQRSRQGTYAFADGTLEIKAGQLTFPVPATADAILRARVRKTGVPDGDRNLNMRLRVGDTGSVSACFNGEGQFCLGRMGPLWRPLVRSRYPDFNDADEFELAVAVVENRAWVFANGHRVLAADLDVALPPGRPDVGLHDRARTETAYFRQLQYQPVPPGTLAAAPKPASPPAQQAYERAAATAMRDLRAAAWVWVDDEKRYADVREEIPAGPVSVRAVHMASTRHLGRLRPFEPLRWCEHLEELVLDGSKVFDTDLDWLDNCRKLKRLSINSTDTTGRVLARLKGANDLRRIDCWGVQVTDEDLKALAGKSIEEADFTSWKLTDACAETVQGWKRLKSLRVALSSVGDEFLANAAPWPELEKLHLYNTRVGDRGVAHLRKCPKLTDIHLGETAVTDEALTHLAGIPTLKKLTVYRTKVTADGVAKFRAARPDCAIVTNEAP